MRNWPMGGAPGRCAFPRWHDALPCRRFVLRCVSPMAAIVPVPPLIVRRAAGASAGPVGVRRGAGGPQGNPGLWGRVPLRSPAGLTVSKLHV